PMLIRALLVAAFAIALHLSLHSRPRNLALPRSEDEFLQLWPESRGLYIAPQGNFIRLSHGWTHYTSDLPSQKNSNQVDVVRPSSLSHACLSSFSSWVVSNLFEIYFLPCISIV